MKFTLSWLRDYIETKSTATEIADKLTLIGLEVDEIIDSSSELRPFVAGKILTCDQHPNADRLHLLTVDCGDEIVNVVCGAPNARTGMVGVLAKPGVIIPSTGTKLTAGMVRGIESNGMMCSAAELKISDDHSGIIELDSNTKPGTSLADIIKSEIVFVAGITPNRPDYLSVRGIAHDLIASGLGTSSKNNCHCDATKSPQQSQQSTPLTVKIMDTTGCPIYRAGLIKNTSHAESNDTIKQRLRAIGINPKSALIDATNYICYDMAQPMHVFDADKIVGGITVRRAISGEQMLALNNETYTLTENDLVITDDEKILAIAGVMGGTESAATSDTKNIVLESAYFDPVSVRKTSRRLGLSSDSSYRYERGIDPTSTESALAFATKIITERCGGEIYEPITAGKIPTWEKHIKYDPKLFKQKIGIDLSDNEQKSIFEKLGFIVDTKKTPWTVTPSAARVDIELNVDLVEELIRIYGYDHLSGTNVRPEPMSISRDELMSKNFKIKRQMASMGLMETLSFSFTDAKLEKLFVNNDPILLSNPITSELDALRQTLLTNILDSVKWNQQMGNTSLKLFEYGPVFYGNKPFEQNDQLTIVRTGLTEPKHWSGHSRNVDVFDVKSDIMQTLSAFGINAETMPISTDNAPIWAHPFRFGHIMIGKQTLATFGELHPTLLKKLKLRGPVVIAQLFMGNVPSRKKSGSKRPLLTLPDLQPITRDFAFILDESVLASDLIKTVAKADTKITNVSIFDLYVGNEIGKNKKSIALTITIQPTDKTLTDDDLNAIQTNVINMVAKNHGGEIRDS